MRDFHLPGRSPVYGSNGMASTSNPLSSKVAIQILEAGGNNLKEFLTNLPQLHNHIMLMYPKLTPPEFKTSNIESNSIQIHYFSKRVGLQEFVRGLLSGLSKMYTCDTTIELLSSRNSGDDHETFKVSW